MRDCILGCVLGITGCISGGGHGDGTGGQTVNLVGATPEEAAIDVAKVVCGHMDMCPDVSVECSSSGMGTGGSQSSVDVQCVASLREADATCEDEIGGDVIEIFANCGDEPNFDKQLTDCINALTGECVTYTQADLDRIEAAVESGDVSALDDVRPPQPPECVIIETCIGRGSSMTDSGIAPGGGEGSSSGGGTAGAGGAGPSGGGAGGASAFQDAAVPADG